MLVAPTPGVYTTIVAARLKGALSVKAVTGGPCRSPEDSGRLELANFTDGTVVASVDGKTLRLGPGESKATDVPTRSHTVVAPGTAEQTVDVGEKEIWTVCYVPSEGKTLSRSVCVKSVMATSATRGSTPR